MRLHIISVGHKMPTWVKEGFQEYQKRFLLPYTLEITEIQSKARQSSQDIEKIKEEEGEKIVKLTPKNSLVVALDEQGQLWNTIELSQKIQHWQMETSVVTFLIGGPDGLSKECIRNANYRWSLSPLTFPHPLVRVILVEQLYRVISILQNHPYHRI